MAPQAHYYWLVFSTHIKEMLNTKGITFLLNKVVLYYQHLIRIVLSHFRYSVGVPGVTYSAEYNSNLNEWFHSVINFNGERLILYFDGILHPVSGHSQFTPGAINNGRMAIGRQFIENNDFLTYTEFAVDELLFFNRTLTKTEISMFAQTTWKMSTRITVLYLSGKIYTFFLQKIDNIISFSKATFVVTTWNNYINRDFPK